MPEPDDENPAFVLLELLQDAGWEFEEIDTESFLNAAEYCDEKVPKDSPDS